MPPSVPLLARQARPRPPSSLNPAVKLVRPYRGSGLAGSVPQVGDGVIRGYLVSVEGGSAAKRFVIGFGAGVSEMDAVIEGFAVTAQGWRKLGSGTLSSSGNKMPGIVAGRYCNRHRQSSRSHRYGRNERFMARRAAKTHSKESQGVCRRHRGAAQDSSP